MKRKAESSAEGKKPIKKRSKNGNILSLSLCASSNSQLFPAPFLSRRLY